MKGCFRNITVEIDRTTPKHLIHRIACLPVSGFRACSRVERISIPEFAFCSHSLSRRLPPHWNPLDTGETQPA